MPPFQEMLTLRSTYRESLVEHLFLGQLLPLYWKANPPRPLEVSKPLVDDAGYDLILDAPNVVRHVQLKGSFRSSTTNGQNVHVRLASKPSGCVLWITYDSNLELGPFHWFGNEPGKRLPDLSNFPIAKRGNKKRLNVHRISKGRFKLLTGLEDVCAHLFGASAITPERKPRESHSLQP